MAKAADEANTTWILLYAALALVVDTLQDPKLARNWLQQQLEKGNVRWRYWVVERGLGPPLVLPNAEPGEPSAWRWHDPAMRVVLTINWPQSAIHRAGKGYYSR